MNLDEVPQQNISTYANNKKAVYAVDRDGKYTRVATSGWEVEEAATRLALAEYARQAVQARKEVEAGRKAPLYYHIYANRMDIPTLAQATGLFRWRIRRHLKPHVFASLSAKIIARYADALGISASELCTLPGDEGKD